MINKLQSLYPNALLLKDQPIEPMNTYHLFFDQSNNEWLAIPRNDLDESEFMILKTLYELIEPSSASFSPLTKGWFDFLYKNGQLPVYGDESVRFIQFYFHGDVEQSELESALKGFLTDKILVVWENTQGGVIILKPDLSFISDKELKSMSKTFESDFYITIYLYLGKLYPFSSQLSSHLQEEKEYFTFGQNHLGQIKIYTFERVFPSYLAFYLPEILKGKMNQALINVFKEDTEMYVTLKVFLENNLNASLTAKQLYIHRNTLQYRIEKFSEKTGIQLKDFHSAFTVFLTCLVFEQSNLM
ncbi:MAG: helix-turn-helix domain-containing protein [Bacillota bacterium]|nr:helix-turn-helix domain-containing protein [Bacillota bacterium]